jgi:hypothetical protein
MKPPDPADAERRIERLRDDITTDLAALRKVWGPAQWTRRAAGDWTAQAARLRGIPAWAVGAVAGVLAGVWSALRRPRKAK